MRLFGLILAGAIFVMPMAHRNLHAVQGDDQIGFYASASPAIAAIRCGYDSRGAEDHIHAHRLHSLRSMRQVAEQLGSSLNVTTQTTVNNVDDVAVIEDDGTIVAAPSSFDLKKRSVLITPAGEGYQIATGNISFEDEIGSRLTYFLGPDGQLGTGNNGYREIALLDSPFSFFGVSYDRIYVGTNGFITFEQGDTTSKVSASALATEMPRIAPLWADLDVSNKGSIHYSRLVDRHVVTWKGAGQALYSGASTFQAILYDDGRIAFVYKKVKARSALVGISPGHSEVDPQPIDFLEPDGLIIRDSVFETFSKQKRLDLPALTRAFYRAQPDEFDAMYIWADFPYDNGLGVAHSFNVRNDTQGIGLRRFDRGGQYGSPSRLSTLVTLGVDSNWPSDPQTLTAGLNTAICIVAHELGHRWLAYVRFNASGEVRDDLLGRENAHWSFLADTRTNPEGGFTSLMEGNAWKDAGAGIFTSTQSAVNHFAPLDQYLMGLRSAGQVGEIAYLATDLGLTELLREKSPVKGFSLSAVRRTISIEQIIAREGPRVPDVTSSPKQFRVAFVLLTEKGKAAASSTIEKVARYRDSLVRYFSVATGRRASLDGALSD